MSIGKFRQFTALILLVLASSAFGVESERKQLHGSMPTVISSLVARGQPAPTKSLTLSLGLPLHNEAALDELVSQLYDPGSTNYHQFLSSAEVTARFGPTASDYQAVRQFAESYGLKITGTFSNRMVLDVSGQVADVERAFQVKLHTYRHPSEPRDFFAPDTEPSVPTNLPVADMLGLSDYSRPKPMAQRVHHSNITPLNYNGTGAGGSYQGTDFRNAYIPGSTLDGTGQVVALFELDGYFTNDILSYEAICGYPNVPLSNVWVNIPSTNSPGYSGVNGAVDEVSLDIEMTIAMAPGLSSVMIYQGNNAYDVFNQIAADNIAKQISSSWAFNYGPSTKWHNQRGTTLDSIFKIFNMQGQAMFQASGDSDAYTGTQAISAQFGPIPVDSAYLTSVGATSLTMNGSGASWNSETVWNWNNSGQPDVGSAGGISPNYQIPSWQTNLSMAANNGSTANRNFPDVALTGDAVFVVYSNGLSAIFGGTSCAAPLWAGFSALANQQSLASGGTNLGFLNPALYAIAGASCYTNCFNDITNGNNIGNQTAGLYYAVPGYDLATGLGTPNGTNLINALISPPPVFTAQPIGKTVPNGTTVTLTGRASSATPMAYFWVVNGTNLPAGSNVSGLATNTLVITAATTNNSGSYQLIASNATGLAFSRVAILNVGLVPTASVTPASLTLLAGSNAVFTAIAGGNAPFSYQWKKNGTNFSGAGISGTNTNVLTLAGITTNSAANYSVVITNVFGAVTSGVAPLTVVVPAAVTLTLVSSANPNGFKNNLSFTASVAPTNATGSIQFFTNGTGFDLEPLVAGSASSVNVFTLPRGTNLIAASYSGSFYFLPATNSLTQIVTNHPPQVITAFYTLVAGLNLNIAVTNLATNWSDADGDMPYLAAISPSTNGVIVTNNASFLFYSNPNWVNDQFVCTVCDGFGGTNFQTVSILIVPQTNATPNISAIASQSASVSLTLNGGYGSTYILESATNLPSGPWSPLATNSPNLAGIWQFTDGQTTNIPCRFYRLKLTP